MSWSGFLAAYVLGGLTFLPLVLVAVFLHAYLTLPDRTAATRPDDAKTSEPGPVRHPEFATSDLENLPPELKRRPHVPDVAAGYFAVCREYVPGGINGKPPERTTPAGSVVAAESPSVYQSMYRSIFDRNKTMSPTIDAANGKSKKARNVFYVVLRLGYLMLYDDSEQLEVRHVISLAHYDVDIYAGGRLIPEGELWIKRNCIRLSQKVQLQSNNSDPKPFYLFSENCSEKEDFYHAMLQSQDHSDSSARTPPQPLGFDAPDLIKLVQQLHTSEENMHTRWINALIGRVFLAMYKTHEVENFIRNKITKKIARVPKPALISSVSLRKVDMGHLPPFITNPRLRELTVDGDLMVEADVSYKGEFRIEISAIARIELGQRFKAREVTLVLATILKKLEGHLLLRVKPPPSNRLWITFETPPKMELSLEPIVSSRQITYGVVLRAIESRIREVVSETLVLPNWDDMPFSDTGLYPFRGGIWADNAKEEPTDTRSEMDAPQHDRKSQDLDEDDTDLPMLSSKDNTKSMPDLTARRRPSSTKSAATVGAIADTDGVGVSTATDVRPRAKPRAMRSGSFASAASPVVSTDPANASKTESDMRDGQDAASMMMAVSSSQPTSPVETPVGSPTQPLSIHQARRSTSPAAMRSLEDDLEQKLETIAGETADPSASLNPSSASVDSSGSSTTTTPQTKPKHTSSLSLPRNTFGSAEKRQTINQSINSATAAAKKWFANRQAAQTSNSPGSPVFGAAFAHPQHSPTSSESGSNNRKSVLNLPVDSSAEPSPVLGSPANPVFGRGQPLPPPGTPLPPPSKSRNSGWSVPAAATFANLTKRKPVAQKGPTSHSELNSPRDPSPSSTPDTALSARIQGIEGPKPTADSVPTTRRKSSARSGEMPPPLPARRKRMSSTGTGSRKAAPDEGLLVVAAPPADTSAPTSPVVEHPEENYENGDRTGVEHMDEEDSDGIEGKLPHSGHDEDEGVFASMDIDEKVA
ncbi:hypothetical protein BDV96DRAFT_503236 [Lophiotrema nucula]|uniref:SMP-LTD domain-containing protein n=1 Tax=Lophiotrema nucula TaxID=690887 RepID=A0A6A5YPV2_9PLEO|nr:hypothetical protein BDV96DRAFT_503236 [Lophiotrema nucula]